MSKLADGEEVGTLLRNVNQLESELKELNETANQVKLENKFDIDCTKSIAQLNKLKEEYESLGRDTSGIDKMINEIEQLQSAVNSANLGNFQKDLNKITAEATQMKSTLGGLKDSVSNTFSDFASSLSAFTIGNVLGDAVTSGIYSLKDEILSL